MITRRICRPGTNAEVVTLSPAEETDKQAEWANETTPEAIDARKESEAASGINTLENKLFRDLFYDLDARVRILEGLPAVSKSAFTRALLDKWKALIS